MRMFHSQLKTVYFRMGITHSDAGGGRTAGTALPCGQSYPLKMTVTCVCVCVKCRAMLGYFAGKSLAVVFNGFITYDYTRDWKKVKGVS
jgi:hypothetical protein